MRVSHSISADFDDPNLVSAGGLAPTMALAEQAGLAGLVADWVSVGGSAGANAALKVPAMVAGMVAGADSIQDMGLLRHGGMGRLFSGLRAPTTLGTHLRGYTFGNVRQLDAVASRLLINLAGRAPILAGADQIAYLDIDDTIRQTHGYAKQGVGYGYNKVKGLNAQLAVLSTPLAAPVIAATRLRKGNVASAHGAARLIGDALSTAKKAGATGTLTMRADSAYYNADVVAAASRGGAHFSITARMDKAVTAAISRIQVFVDRIRLHQMAVSGSDNTVAIRPLTDVLHPAVRVMHGTAAGIHAHEQQVQGYSPNSGDGWSLPFDSLVYAVGSGARPTAVPGAGEFAFNAGDVDDVLRLRAAIREVGHYGTVLVIGRGPTAAAAGRTGRGATEVVWVERR